MKDIETVGITLNSGGILKGALVFIAGDNLGSHGLGGFTENFSRAPYFCRYCLMKRTDFFSPNRELKTYEERTVESYNNVIEKIENRKLFEENGNESVQTAVDCKGIKFNSIFNRLNYYHVCEPGLPPCLGHDILECIISYDGKLFIDDLIQKKKMAQT